MTRRTKVSTSTAEENRKMPSPLPPAPFGEKRPVQDEQDVVVGKRKAQPEGQQHCCGRERLQRHRSQVAGRVWIPEVWGKEQFLKEWTDCAALDRALMPMGLVSAKSALVEECRRSAGSGGLRIDLAAV
ncbi:protein BIC1-like [Nymphaea colorata]|uniref:Uncharacterized protein n=1 Tax=Nymphaea colorata TaxID=210225 RepID=A0A5K0Z255_9MAGN|nr:protein BIC1-like [Nymphaea colorata]